MKLDTLTYKYNYESSTQNLFQTLLDEQLKYFQYHDPNIAELKEGQQIDVHLKTKIRQYDSPTKMKITKIVPNKEFQLVTDQVGDHDITQTFKFVKGNKNQNQLVYSEQTNVKGARSQGVFFMTGLLYKFFYDRAMKKKFIQLDKMALN